MNQHYKPHHHSERPVPGRAVIDRDKALERVLDNTAEWKDRAIVAIRGLIPGEYTGEDVRLDVETEAGHPHHHNAWGAIIRKAVMEGTLVATGEWRKMVTKKSHARQTPVYNKIGVRYETGQLKLL